MSIERRSPKRQVSCRAGTRTGFDATPKRWRYEEYYRSTAEGEWFEFVDGVNLGAERSKLLCHQRWLAGVTRIFDTPKIDRLGKLCLGPLDVVLNEENVVQPDLLFITAARKHIIEERAIFGSPDIMIEIVSPATLVMDRYRKPLLYARFGVPEYWIVDPGHDSIEILELQDGKYDLASFAAETGKVRSPVLDLEFDVVDVTPKAD